MEFKLSKQQEEKFLKWKKKQKVPKMQTAIGGAYTFSFTPTGIGDFVEVKCNYNGKTLDLTEDL